MRKILFDVASEAIHSFYQKLVAEIVPLGEFFVLQKKTDIFSDKFPRFLDRRSHFVPRFSGDFIQFPSEGFLGFEGADVEYGILERSRLHFSNHQQGLIHIPHKIFLYVH